MRTFLENICTLIREIINIKIAFLIVFINKSMEECIMKTKILMVGAFLAGLAALFQTIPAFTSEALVFLTVFSALPIYVIARINPRIGSMAYLVAAAIVMLFSVHEGLFFLCTNGLIGLSLGIFHSYSMNKLTICLAASSLLTVALSIMSFVIGIPVFGIKLPIPLFAQLFVLLAFSVIYIIIYHNFSNFIFKLLIKYYDFDK